VLFSRSKGVVGLDIGSSAVKMVELKERKGEFHLQRLGIEPLSPEAIVDGSIMDSSLVVDAVHKLNDQTKVKGTNYATSLSGHSVIIKKIQLPAMPSEELAESIQWEAEQYIPFDINDVRLDHVVLSEGEPGRDNMEVLLVAVKRDKVNDYVSVISQTGKTATLVDVDALAVQSCYEANYDLDPRKVVALVNMGAGVTNINILARGTTVFWRDISFGGNQFTEALQREFNLSFEQAEALKRGESVDRYTLADARPVLDTVSGEMAAEIRKTFDFFAATSAEGAVDELVLAGGCALTPNLQQVLRDRFEVAVELMNPLRRIHYKESDFDSAWLQTIAPMMAVSVGLAVRNAADNKINLLTEGKRPAAVRKGKQASQILQGQDVGVWLLGGGVLVCVIAFALLFWLLSSAIKQKDEEIVTAQKRVDELAEVIKQVDEYKAKKTELERKITVINDLKLSQRGPVRIMDDVSRALPELLWLDRMSVADSSIEVEGRSFNENAVAAFMDNLDNFPEFEEPLLKDLTEQTGGVYKFVVNFSYSFAPPAATAEAGTEAAPAADTPKPAATSG
jgi:type IV pilus assembly protein PilM